MADLTAWMSRARQVLAWWNGANPADRAEEEWAEELALAYWSATSSVDRGAAQEAAAKAREFARRLPDGLVVALCQDQRLRGRRKLR